jgi:DNA-binding GntR family transcriptional regulator
MKENQVEKAYRLISDMIFKYQLPPGAFISDFTLSKSLEMSRTPVRQAIMMLLNHGLVITTEKGFKVPEITLDSIDELYDARFCLEPALLKFSMLRGIEESSIALLREKIKLEEECYKTEKLIEALDYDLEFHRVLSSLCHNDKLEHAYRNLEFLMIKLNVFSLASPNFDTPKVYSEICDAIEAGDAEDACAKLEASIESGRLQKKNVIEKFRRYGLQGIYNFISNSFKDS